MKKSFWILACFLVLPVMLKAQCTSFKVFHVSGKAIISFQGKHVPVEKKMVFTGGNIELFDDSQVILFSEARQAVLLTKPGKYSIDMLREICKKATQGMAEMYLDYIYEEMMEQPHSEGQRIRTVIERGAKGLMLCPPDSSAVLADFIHFVWKNEPAAGIFYVTLKDSSNRVIAREKTANDTQFVWHIPASYKLPVKLTWHIGIEPRPAANDYFFTITAMDPAKVKTMLSDLDTRCKELNINREIQYLMQAGLLLQQGLILQAEKIIQEGCAAYPENTDLSALLQRVQSYCSKVTQ